MRRFFVSFATAALLTLTPAAVFADHHETGENPCNPCEGKKNPCEGEKNPCGENPCNPCEGKKAEAEE